MESKARISVLIPYKRKEGQILVYLQKRTKDAVRLPDYFGFFGGHAENDENPKETLRREIEEELNIVPKNYNFLGMYEFTYNVKHAFTMEVDEGFEGRIQVLEGEYGRFFDKDKALNEPKLIEEDKIILRALYLETKFLSSLKT